MPENTRSSFSSLELSYDNKMSKNTCILNEPTNRSMVESKNIHVKNNYLLKSWCSFPQYANQNYFLRNDSPPDSIIENDVRSHSDTFSSDIIPNKASTSGNLIEDDQSEIRLHLERRLFYKGNVFMNRSNP